MTIGQAVLGFTSIAVVVTVIPGLDTTLVLRSALTRGRGYAIATALGITLGALVWGMAAALGASALLAASEPGYRIVTTAGAVYLVYLGVRMVVATFRGGDLVHASPTSPTPSTSPTPLPSPSRGARSTHSSRKPLSFRGRAGWQAFATGLWTNLLNPKVGVFYIATIPQFIPDGAWPLGMGALLASVHGALGLIWFALIIAAASVARRWLANAGALRIVDRIAGLVLIGFGVGLALQPRI